MMPAGGSSADDRGANAEITEGDRGIAGRVVKTPFKNTVRPAASAKAVAAYAGGSTTVEVRAPS